MTHTQSQEPLNQTSVPVPIPAPARLPGSTRLPGPDPAGAADKPNLRKQILKIQRDTSLSAKDKHKMMFSLFNQKTAVSPGTGGIGGTGATDPCGEFVGGERTEEGRLHVDTDSRERVKNMLRNLPIAEENIILSPGGARIRIPCSQLGPCTEEVTSKCQHYDRQCSMYAECCHRFFPCRLCHDHETGTHTLERKKVKVIKCRACHLIQVTGDRCQNEKCATKFAEYHCSLCNLWLTPPADKPDMNVYHCHKCSVCLIGHPGIDAEHCDECGFCMPMDKYKVHHCQAISSEEICGICREGFETLGQAEKTKCGHVFHLTCMESYMHHDISCPICKRTLFDMTKTWQSVDVARAAEIIPEEYRTWRVRFICHDCQSMTEDRISYIGNKCGTCAGYNTAQQDLIKD